MLILAIILIKKWIFKSESESKNIRNLNQSESEILSETKYKFHRECKSEFKNKSKTDFGSDSTTKLTNNSESENES